MELKTPSGSSICATTCRVLFGSYYANQNEVVNIKKFGFTIYV